MLRKRGGGGASSSSSAAPPKVVISGGLRNQVQKETYLRSDIPCGLAACQECPKTQSPLSPQNAGLNVQVPEAHVVLPDTNILLHHMDLLELSGMFEDILLLQTVLDEVRSNSPALYQRARGLEARGKRVHVFSNEHHRETHITNEAAETPNDRNDRAIRRVAEWYQKEHRPKNSDKWPLVILLTNDRENKRRAIEEDNLRCMSLGDYIKAIPSALKDDHIRFLLERFDSFEGEEEDGREEESKAPEHLSLSVLKELIRDGKAYQGVLQCSAYSHLEGSVSTGLSGELASIRVSGRDAINRAMHGDTVAVVLESTENLPNISAADLPIVPTVDEDVVQAPSSRTGRIVGILNRKIRTVVGALTASKGRLTNLVLFVPIDRRLPWVELRTRNADSLRSQRLVVSIDGWERGRKNPHGHLVKLLGQIGDRAVETEAILLAHNVAHEPWTAAVLACLPDPVLGRPSEADLGPTREDLRGLDVVSVDPPGCTDIDDALHARWLVPGERVEVGVHIADVTHYVQAGSALDREAAARGTTVYLVDRRIDMLPGLLGTDLCSLKEGVERLAFSLLCIVDWATGEPVEVRFCKSLIRSRASFTYDQAQERLDTEESSTSDDPLTASLVLLNSLAQRMRAKRFANGALSLASPEVRFSIDTTTSNPTDVQIKESKAANAMVEEFMLLANRAVAQRLLQHLPATAILRRHPAPPVENFAALNEALAAHGIAPLDPSTSARLSQTLDEAVLPDDPFFNRLVRIMATRCMLQAVYFSAGSLPEAAYWHYGLACPLYTHFTSPIRRYADVLVHRQLMSTITGEKSEDDSGPAAASCRELEDVCDNLNYRNRMSQQAQRSSVELFTHLLFAEMPGGGCTTEAYIIKLLLEGRKDQVASTKSDGRLAVVLIPKYGIEGILSSGDEGTDEKERLRLFQRVMVTITVREIEAGQQKRLQIRLAGTEESSNK